METDSIRVTWPSQAGGGKLLFLCPGMVLMYLKCPLINKFSIKLLTITTTLAKKNIEITFFLNFIYCHREHIPFRQHTSKVLVVLVREPGFNRSKFYMLAKLEPGSPA